MTYTAGLPPDLGRVHDDLQDARRRREHRKRWEQRKRNHAMVCTPSIADYETANTTDPNQDVLNIDQYPAEDRRHRSSKKTNEEPPDRYPRSAEFSKKPSGPTDPEESQLSEPLVGIPRGLQVIPTHGHFRFPRSLLAYGVTQNDWIALCHALMSEIQAEGRTAFAVEGMCDVAAYWDSKCFRPKGLIMRLDMPGEVKFGLDFMDLTSDGRHVKNLGHMMAGTITEKRRKFRYRSFIWPKVRTQASASIRLVFDPISVLNDSKLSHERGWSNWSIACAYAANPRGDLPPLQSYGEERGFSKIPAGRKDRWPPSKHYLSEKLTHQRLCGKKFKFWSDGWAEDEFDVFVADPTPNPSSEPNQSSK